MSGLAIRVVPSATSTSMARAELLLDGIKECGPDRTVATVKGQIEVAHASFFTTPESRFEEFPVAHPNRDMWVVADARLDYLDELRSELRVEGCSFEPTTDADFILAAHEVWGDEAQNHLIGDFAYAVWDAGKLVVARDVLGMRPLWWVQVENEVVIASTIRCVLAQLPATPPPNECFIADLLVTSLSRNDYTAYEGVYRLAPGARLVAVPGEAPVVEIVDRLRLGTVAKVDRGTAMALVRAAFERAVNERLRTIGPVACELSGGLDSSTVAGVVATAMHPGRLLAISNVFPGHECDESQFIASVSERFDIELHKCDPLSLEAVDLRRRSSFTRDIVAFPDQSTELWSLGAASGRRTVLTGQGGDEAFGTPEGFEADAAGGLGPVKVGRMFLAPQNSTRRQLFRTLTRSVTLRKIQRFPRIGQLVEGGLAQRRLRRMRWVGKSIRDQIARRSPAVPLPGERAGWNRSERHAIYTSPNNVWAYEHMHQASGGLVDLRHPFADRPFIELVLTMPTEILYPNGVSRAFHRRAFEDVLTPDVVARHDKAEFSAYYRASIVHNAPAGFGSLSTHRLNWTIPELLTQWADAFLSGEQPNRVFPLWQSLTVSCWLDAVLDDDRGDSPAR